MISNLDIVPLSFGAAIKVFYVLSTASEKVGLCDETKGEMHNIKLDLENERLLIATTIDEVGYSLAK